MIQWLHSFALLVILRVVFVVAEPSLSSPEPGTYLRHQRRALEKKPRYIQSNVTVSSNVTGTANVSYSALADAQKLVDAMLAQQSIYNTYRVEFPRRNNYYADNLPKPGSVHKKTRRRDEEPVPPVLNSTIRAAAAMLAEHHAQQLAANASLHKIYQQPTKIQRFDETAEKRKRASSDYWLGSIAHTGLAPMGQNNSWVVFRDVTKFGAKGDVGDANDLPIIRTSPSFIGLGAIETDVYEPGKNGDEWYINQSNFYRQLVCIGKWRKAHRLRMWFMGECFFYGGKYGIYGGNQQYTVRSFEFMLQTTASICLIWDWGWTWSQLHVVASPIGIMLINPDNPTGQQAGSTYILDSGFYDVGTVIFANTEPAKILESSIITLDNIGVEDVTSMVTFSDGTLLNLPVGNVDFVIVGNVEAAGPSYGMYQVALNNPSPLLTTSAVSYFRDSYFYKSRPQYEDLPLSYIINVKTLGAKGDGVTDDTAIINKALALTDETNLVYFPAGSYIVTSTITVAPSTRITGEVWSQLVASGSAGNFQDGQNPQAMIKVGEPGDVGVVEISDMLFTSIGALPGLVLMDWNIAADEQGSAGLWDAHFRVGGATGTKLQVAECPKGAAIQKGCIAAAMMLHITPGANGYFENMWAWVADHDLDDASNTMVTVACARGILIESQGPTWMLGTASEHSMLYQYNFYQTSNVWAGMIQTESPYFQYTTNTESPGVFSDSVGIFSNDPIFPDSSCKADDLMCNFSWAVMIYATQNLTIAGAGLYSWFDNYDQSVCVDAQNCQQRLLNNQGANDQLYFFNLVTIGSVEMVSDTETGTIVYAANNTQDALNNYTTVDDGYDSVFKYYVKAVKDMVPAALASFMAPSSSDNPSGGTGNKYFKCDFVETYGGGNDKITYDPCPIPWHQIDYVDKYTMTYTLEDSEGFFNDLLSTYGIEQSWVSFGTYANVNNDACGGNVGGGGPGSNLDRRCDGIDIYFYNYPKVSGNVTVSNPKDIVTAALPSVATLQNTIMARQLDLLFGQWTGPTDDLIQVISMPVLLMVQAVQSMQSAKEEAEKEKKEEQKELILEILGIVFAFIPFLDDIAPAIEGLDIAMEIFDVAGNAALAIQGIVAHPEEAPMEILGALGAGVDKNEEDIAALAKARRGISSDDIGKIGAKFQNLDKQMQDMIKAKACRI
ncbi:hypothetical protein UCRPA7_6324 [Phaeoacremonium minimum UCRPA7]|uniref:Rhamnogalacturonase A/B/Epimerase-like pectate lyase domain-containing protein n=1 Tax=Phaeoacremonium minimum (strain UCR-PA7) TaxID=1286976 RepID=R8BFU9_PHAM7|nr:hypothetical protein UCRPA7_6324 [Phaeoacremonium minimum UCRPA7]EON98175.1 hypothetical protein UCRPA7_6324 [Phaeoacremonium minimum UCRPA7]